MNPLHAEPLEAGLWADLDEDSVLLSVNVLDDGSVRLRGQGEPDAAHIAFMLRLIADQLD